MDLPQPATRYKYALLALGLLFKLAILAKYGPFLGSDTPDYTQPAQAILSDRRIFHEVLGWASAALPGYAFRPLGYPALIAASIAVAGNNFGYCLAALQAILSVVVAGLLFDVAFRITRTVRFAVAAVALYFISETVLWDNEILSDSLYASLFNIVVLTALLGLLNERKLSSASLIGLGLLWGFSILTRDSGLYFTIIPTAILLAPALVRPEERLRRAAPAMMFLLPVIVSVGLYMGWNAYRTGEPFIGLSPVANYLQPAFAIERKGLGHPFDSDSAVDRVVRDKAGSYDYIDLFYRLQDIHDALGLKSPIELKQVVFRKYVDTVVRHPVAYGLTVAQNLDPRSFGEVLYDPLFTYNEFHQIGVSPYRRVIPGSGIKSLRALAHDGDYAGIGLAILSAIASTAAAVVWIATLVGIPFLAIKEFRRRRTLSRETAAAAIMLAVFCAVAGFFALVHIESRYDLAIVPAGLLATVYMANAILKRRRGVLAPG